MRNIHTQETTIPNPLDGRYNVTPVNSEAFLLERGWRYEPPQPPPVLDGYERNNIRLIEGDGRTGTWAYDDTRISDRLAAVAAAEAQRKATPLVYDQAIEAPLFSVLSQTSAKGIGITATDDGELVTIIVHESPWPDAKTLSDKIKAAIDKKNAAKATAKAGINGQLQTRLENIERLLGLRQ